MWKGREGFGEGGFEGSSTNLTRVWLRSGPQSSTARGLNVGCPSGATQRREWGTRWHMLGLFSSWSSPWAESSAVSPWAESSAVSSSSLVLLPDTLLRLLHCVPEGRKWTAGRCLGCCKHLEFICTVHGRHEGRGWARLPQGSRAGCDGRERSLTHFNPTAIIYVWNLKGEKKSFTKTLSIICTQQVLYLAGISLAWWRWMHRIWWSRFMRVIW